MMSLLFLLFFVAMICLLAKKITFAYTLFSVGILLGLLLLNHHAADVLPILL